MKKFTKQLCEQERLKYDRSSGIYAGYCGGFSVVLTPINSNNQLMASVSVTNSSFPDKDIMKQGVKDCKSLKSCTVQGYRVNFVIKTGMTQKKQLENIHQALEFIPQFLLRNGYSNCCEKCGQVMNTDVYCVGGKSKILCQEDFTGESQATAANTQAELSRKDNVISGFAGALLGSLIGAVVMILIAQLGYVAAWTGVIMGACTMKGYSMLGGKLSKKGVVISVLVMIVMVYFSNQMDWAIALAREFQVNVFDIFSSVGEIVEDFDIASRYYANLALMYFFTLLGFIPTAITIVKKHKASHTAYKI